MAASGEFNVVEFMENENLSIQDLEQLRKCDLRLVADQIGVSLSSGMRKREIIDIIAGDFKLELQPPLEQTFADGNSLELAKIEFEREKLKFEQWMKSEEFKREKEQEDFELRKIELQSQLSGEHTHFGLVQEFQNRDFDVAKNIRLIPKFCEDEVDSYFLAFEKIAKQLDWPRRYWTILLQSVLTGKAQEVFSSLSDEQSENYEVVKKAMFAYELVPEAYRQKFRNLQRQTGQTFVEFAREKEIVFDKWYRSLQAGKELYTLREVILIEEFMNSIPSAIKTHLDEHKVRDLKCAAAIAEDYELTHKKFSSPYNFNKYVDDKRFTSKQQSDSKSKSNSQEKKIPYNQRREHRKTLVCYYCGKAGHVKAQCFKWIKDN
ncbi:uncharacterized protein [Ptychodera flava]|uniref:uncharacterized protein n=1 Tax=Ptychodera flava TaxID=63121 RepID=UPI00396A6370